MVASQATTIDVEQSTLVPRGAAAYLGMVQFFFACMWTAYVVFLPALLESVGIPRSTTVWVLMADQLVFTVTDFALGVAADQTERALGRLGPAILVVTVISALAFLLMPQVAALAIPGAFSQTVLLSLIGIWAVSSSALRAPAWVLLMKHTATPNVPKITAITLVGTSLGVAIAPYLSLTLRGMDPRLPFTVASVGLVAVTVGLIWLERELAAQGGFSGKPQPQRQLDLWSLGLFGGAGAFLGLGLQAQLSFATASQYLRYAGPEELDLLFPLFWVGFNLLSLPTAPLVSRVGGVSYMAWAALFGVIGVVLAALAPNLGLTVLGQMMAGGAWGCLFMTAFSVCMGIGRVGHEGKVVGLWFSMQSVASALRLGLVALAVDRTPQFGQIAYWLPPTFWLVGGLLFFALVARSRAEQASAA